MIITLSGTHCTGKTTLFEALKKRPELKDAYFHRISGREEAEKLPILKNNEGGNFLTQFYYMSKNVQEIIECIEKPLVILDRCYLDTYIYSSYLQENEQIDDGEFNVLDEMFLGIREIVERECEIRHFLLKPSFSLQNEKDRSMNEKFQTDIYKLFDYYSVYHRPKHCAYLPDKLEDRIDTILSFVLDSK